MTQLPSFAPAVTGSLGRDGSLSPYLFTDRTRKQYDFPLTRSKSANLGALAGMSRLTICQELLPTSDCNEKGDDLQLQLKTLLTELIFTGK